MPKGPPINFAPAYAYRIFVDGEELAVSAANPLLQDGKTRLTVYKGVQVEDGKLVHELERFYDSKPHDVVVKQLDRDGDTILTTYEWSQGAATSYSPGSWDSSVTVLVECITFEFESGGRV